MSSGPAAIRAVLVGDNTSEPRLEFLPNSATVYEGDAVSTSGHGGMLPRGLQIGVVSRSAEPYRVQTNATLGELEYVSVLFTTSPVIAAQDKRDARATRSLFGRGDDAERAGRAAANLRNKHVKAKEEVQAR